MSGGFSPLFCPSLGRPWNDTTEIPGWQQKVHPHRHQSPVTSHQSPVTGGRGYGFFAALRMTGEEAAVLPSNLPCQGEGERRETARRRGVPLPRPDPKAVILSEAQAKSKDPLRSGVFLGIPRLRILRFAQNDRTGGQIARPAIHLFGCLSPCQLFCRIARAAD